MKHFLFLLVIVCSCLSLIATTAEAKRLGGGSSIGKQRSISPQQKATPPSAAPTAPAAAPAPAPAGNRWLGPLAGLAIGAGLGALFSGGFGGMGGAISGILMAIVAGLAVMFIISLFRKKQQPAMAYAGGGAPNGGQPNSLPAAELPGSTSASSPNPASGNIPADFPVEAFLRSAKTSFVRLQAANDRKDLDDIREYTTPEMFAEISMQLRERDNSPQKTDVIQVDARLLEVAQENDLAIASVRLTGQLRENNGAPESFDEVWHVQKNLRDANAVWLLSGIQQIA
jgi:predicted lipid-binding transport protein (Tim44 family)